MQNEDNYINESVIEEWDEPDTIDDLDEIISPINTGASEVKKRKGRTSKARFPNITRDVLAPVGYKRPELRCWVPPELAKPVDISALTPLFRIDESELKEVQAKHKFLATRVVRVHGGYCIKRKSNDKWVTTRNRNEAASILYNDWSDDATQLDIRENTIDEFLKSLDVPTVEGFAYIPGAGDFVEIAGSFHLNLYHEPPMAFRDDIQFGEPFEKLMKLLVRNLINHHEGDLEDWIADITSDEPSLIKWVFHWLASNYKYPGRAIPTMLWLLGRKQGIGKSLFVSRFAKLIGSSNAKKVSAEEFSGEWTDFAFGASLLILDEIDFSSKKEVYNKLKRLVGNQTVAGRKRNVGVFEFPAVANIISTTNVLMPLAIEKGDRRNTFVLTSSAPDAKSIVDEYYGLSPEEDCEAWEGLAFLLYSLDVDFSFISRAFDTDIKLKMIESMTDPVYEWFNSAETLALWPIGSFISVDAVVGDYLEWSRRNSSSTYSNSRYFKGKLQELTIDKLISEKTRRRLPDDTRPHGYVRLDPDRPEVPLDAKVVSLAAAHAVSLEASRYKQIRNGRKV